jgi:hypothetical protein
MVERVYAIYENEISECVLYCISDVFKTSRLFTFLTSEFDVIPIADPVSERTTFTLSVTIGDNGRIDPDTSLLNVPDLKNDPHRVALTNEIKDVCKASFLGKLMLMGNDNTEYLGVLKELCSSINPPLDSLIHSKNFDILFLPFFYLAHGITLQSPQENLLFLPTVELNGLIGVTLQPDSASVDSGDDENPDSASVDSGDDENSDLSDGLPEQGDLIL